MNEGMLSIAALCMAPCTYMYKVSLFTSLYSSSEEGEAKDGQWTWEDQASANSECCHSTVACCCMLLIPSHYRARS